MPLKNDDIKQLIAILQRGLSDSNEEEDNAITRPAKKRKAKEVQSNNIDIENNKTKRINKFDAMMERDMHKNDSKIDQLLSVHPPTTRSREFDPVRVQCRVCQRTEDVNPNLILDSPGRYKCNRCSGAPG
jgi:exonuclease VII large subunit